MHQFSCNLLGRAQAKGNDINLDLYLAPFPNSSSMAMTGSPPRGDQTWRGRADFADGGLLGSHVDKILILGADQRPELDPVVQADQPLVAGKQDGKGTVQQGAAVDLADGGHQFPLISGNWSIRSQKGGARPVQASSGGQAMFPDQEVQHVGNDLGVGQHGAEIAVHLQVALVDAVGRNFAVVDDGPVQQGERMGAAPPAGGIGREAVVGGPDVAGVLFQAGRTRQYPRENRPP